jgi:hypothetical protein
MMNKLTLVLCTALLLSTKALAQDARPGPATGKIDTLVAELSKNPLWINGIAPHVSLGSDASPSQVLHRWAEVMRFDGERIRDYKIVEIRDVVIPPDGSGSPKMTAVLIESNAGPKIVLMQFHGKDWWTRAFDAR